MSFDVARQNAKKNLEEGEVLLDLKYRLSTEIEGLVVRYNNGYYLFKDGGKFIKGSIPTDKIIIDGRKGFRKRDEVIVKYVIRAIPVGRSSFKIFIYSLMHDCNEMNQKWGLEYFIDFTLPIEHWVCYSNIGNFLTVTSIGDVIQTLDSSGAVIDMDLSAVMDTADTFSKNCFNRLFVNVLGLIEDDSAFNQDHKGWTIGEVVKDTLANIYHVGPGFARSWGMLFLYIDLAKKGCQEGIEKILNSGFKSLFFDIFDGDCFTPKLYKVREVADGLPVVDTTKRITEALIDSKWSHTISLLDTVERLSKHCLEDDVLSLINGVNTLNNDRTDENKRSSFNYTANRMLREKKSKRA